MFASKLETTALIVSLIGFLFSGFRLMMAVINRKVRALVKVYSKQDEKVEYNVWFYTYFCLCVTFIAILFLFLLRTFSTATAEPNTSSTGFYISVILVIQFSALIAFVPVLVRMLSAESKTRSGDSKSMIQQICSSTTSLQEASELLSHDYIMESQEEQNGITVTTFSRKSNSSALIRIESQADCIVEIY